MHQEWVKEQQKQAKLSEEPAQSSIAGVVAGMADSPRSDVLANQVSAFASHSASTINSISTSSTTSGFLTRHFPKRYFVVKVSLTFLWLLTRLILATQSHTEEDLHLSVERGLWATQSHNEPVFDQAFRTSDSVFLIFGANRSGGKQRGHFRAAWLIGRQLQNSSAMQR